MGAGHEAEERGVTAPGAKLDAGKDDWSLLPVGPTRAVVRVLMYGAQKYSPDGWLAVPDARRRYYSAAVRHLSAWWEGERADSESGLHHLAHAAACVLFLLHFEAEEARS
jgi:hypothetical protein